MRHRKLVAIGFAFLGGIEGAALAKSVLPSTVPPPAAAPAPRAHKHVANAAYVPGFDIGPRRNRSTVVASSNSSTIPGAPQY